MVGIARQQRKKPAGGRCSGHEREFVIVFATILVMLAAAVLLLAIARGLRLPYPALLALAGAAVPMGPVDVGLDLDPDLPLALFIAPVLLDAAYDTSLRDLKRHWAPVASLA